MAITVKYVVTHNDKEELVTTDKKEADQYDKMLDVADNLSDFIREADLNIDEDTLEELSIKLASGKDIVQKLLKGKTLSQLRAASSKSDDSQ